MGRRNTLRHRPQQREVRSVFVRALWACAKSQDVRQLSWQDVRESFMRNKANTWGKHLSKMGNLQIALVFQKPCDRGSSPAKAARAVGDAASAVCRRPPPHWRAEGGGGISLGVEMEIQTARAQPNVDSRIKTLTGRGYICTPSKWLDLFIQSLH